MMIIVKGDQPLRPPEGGAAAQAFSATDWSKTALSLRDSWPWHWCATAVFDPGPGKRSGQGSVTVLPYLAKVLAGKPVLDPPDVLQGPP